MNDQENFDLEILELFSQAGSDGIALEELSSKLKLEGFEFKLDDVEAACKRLVARGLIEPPDLEEEIDRLFDEIEVAGEKLDALMTPAIFNDGVFQAKEAKNHELIDKFERVRDREGLSEKLLAAAREVHASIHGLASYVEAVAANPKSWTALQ